MIAGHWDAAVIGAGPAGAVAARQLARRGLAVMLIDKARFPRDKVCGCCLSAAAVATLERLGLGHVAHRGVALHELALAAGKYRGRLPIRGCAISRSAFDAALANEAEAFGVRFLPETSAKIHPDGEIELRSGPDHSSCSRLDARAVLVADGIAGTALAACPDLSSRASPDSRIGIAAILPADSPRYERGIIHMTIGRGGYVGAVRLEDGRLNIAAAADPSFIRDSGSPALAVNSILDESGMPRLAFDGVKFHATPGLTRRRLTIQNGRVFILGDAAGYVEPFTGEGIAWALASADAIAPHIAAHLEGAGQTWPKAHRRLVAPRQRLCRGLAWTLRRPLLARAAVRVLSIAPMLARPAVGRVEAPFRPQEATA